MCGGAFTGAHGDRKGCFELADGGTLFFDEISELPPALQPKLLRILEDGIVTPVEASEGWRVEVRVLTASNADFQRLIAAGRFREDLYYRLARFTVEVPPLRDRREDIPLLANHFLRLFAAEMAVPHPAISPAAVESLRAYDFPGNVRELKNIVERVLIESGGETIGEEHLYLLRRAPGLTAAANSLDTVPSTTGQEAGDCGGITREEMTILEHVRRAGSINNTECQQLLCVDMHHAWYLLHKLHRTGHPAGNWAAAGRAIACRSVILPGASRAPPRLPASRPRLRFRAHAGAAPVRLVPARR